MANMEFSDVVRRIVEQYVHEHIYTAMPAKVVNVENLETEQTIDIQPNIVDVFRDHKNIQLPPVLDVPVVFPSAGGGMLSFPIKEGDVVLAVFSQKSIDEWVNSNDDFKYYTPSDMRSYDLNDAIAIPGLYTKKTNLNPNPNDVELKFGDSKITLKSDGNIEINTPNDLVANVGGNVDITAPTINLKGNVSIDGDLSVTGDAEANDVTATSTNNTLSGHEHPGSNAPPTPGT